MSHQFISAVTDAAMSRVCRQGQGWQLTPYRFFVSETDVLEEYKDYFDEKGEIIDPATEEELYKALQRLTSEDVEHDANDDNAGVWFKGRISGLQRASQGTLTHHITIPGDTYIPTPSKTIKTIYFMYKDDLGEFLFAVARCNTLLSFEEKVTSSFIFNFTVTNEVAHELTNFVLNYTCNHDIEDHNEEFGINIHSFLLARDGSRKADGILEYDEQKTFNKPNQLISKQYVDDKINALKQQVQQVVDSLSKVNIIDTSKNPAIQKVDLYIAADSTSYNSSKANSLKVNGNKVLMASSPSNIITTNLMENGSGKSVTFDKGGYIICNTANTITVKFGDYSQKFTNFVGVMPVGMNVSASSSTAFKWHKF